LLVAIAKDVDPKFNLNKHFISLSKINAELWGIEDGKRECERTKSFDSRFIELARSVYIKNDERASIKRKINEFYNSSIIEEKSHKSY
jgi:hypothetical protein